MPFAIVCDSTGLRAADWRAETFDFWAFDRHVDALADAGQTLAVDAAIADEVAIRTQRVAARFNAASSAPWFRDVLHLHRRLHDLDKPLVRADFDHALDAWQWVLRIDPGASASVQLAALLHDIERLVSEAEVRIEHEAADYQAFKDAHAHAGAALARDLLCRADVPQQVIDAACAIIAVHERPSDDPAIRAVNDADALSFFSLNCPGYLAYFGADQTAKKVAYTLARMSTSARSWIPALRLPALIRQHVQHA